MDILEALWKNHYLETSTLLRLHAVELIGTDTQETSVCNLLKLFFAKSDMDYFMGVLTMDAQM